MQLPEPNTEHGIEGLRPLSVVFCITELDPGGAEKALVRFAVGIHQAGWPVHVVSLRDAGALGDVLKAAGIAVTALTCGGFLDFRTVPRLAKQLKRLRPDMLVCFLHQANIVGRLAGRLTGVRNVVSGVRVADRRRFVAWTDRLTKQLTCHYFAVSRHVADVHGQLCGIPESKISVLHNGVDIPDSVQKPRQDDNGTFRILFVGRLTRQKRPLDLVRAVKRLPTELLQRTTVDMLGDGELAAPLRNEIANCDLADRVHVHGHQSDIARWWAESDVLVLPSAWEGLPNVVLEAMAHRVPVIAASVDGVPEIVSHGETGWLVESGNVSELAAALVNAESSADERKRVANRAFDSVRQRFCWQKAIGEFANRLSQLHENSGDTEKHR